MEGTMMRYPLLLAPMLERAANLFPDTEIVSHEPDGSVHRSTYRELRRRTLSLAGGLQRAGLRPGDRVASLMWNHYAYLEAYFGVPASGGVLHTLNLRLHAEELAYIINHGGARFLLMDDTLLPLFEAVRENVHFERVFVVTHGSEEHRPEFESYDDLLSDAPEPAHFHADENAAAIMSYTSGTTGRPRGVVYSHRALVLHSLASALPDGFSLSHRDVVMPLVPMFHANSWGLPFTATMIGAKQVFPGSLLEPQEVLKLMDSEQVTLAAGAPTLWTRILETLDAHAERWRLAPGVRVILGGTAPSEGLLRGLDRQGLRSVHAWGMTETSPVAVVNSLKSALDGLDEQSKMALSCKQGIPVPYVEARIVDERGIAVSTDGTSAGELQVRGPWVVSAYYQDGESAAWTGDGWFRTGDIACIDRHGYIQLVDRAKDLIKSGGEWISSVELEKALALHPAVREAAVIGIPDPRWDERPMAVVVLKPGSQATAEELTRHLSDRFADWQLPESFVFLPQLPHTSTGKVSKAQLRLRFKGLNWERAAASGS